MEQFTIQIQDLKWAFFLLSERLTSGLIIGGILAIGGAWMVTRQT